MRSRHGKSKQLGGSIAPVLETLPISELPKGKKGDLVPPALPQGLGIIPLPTDNALAPYLESALQWREAVAVDLATNVGGGVLSAMCGSLLDSSAHALCWSRYLSHQAALLDDASLGLQAAKFAETSSRLVRECWEYASKSADHRGDTSALDLRAKQIAFQQRLALVNK